MKVKSSVMHGTRTATGGNEEGSTEKVVMEVRWTGMAISMRRPTKDRSRVDG